MSRRLVPVTDVDEAWALRAAGLLYFDGRLTKNGVDKIGYERHCELIAENRPGYYCVLVDDDEEN